MGNNPNCISILMEADGAELLIFVKTGARIEEKRRPKEGGGWVTCLSIHEDEVMSEAMDIRRRVQREVEVDLSKICDRQSESS